jgi:MSHA biogenesis protein MshQ
MRTRTQTKIGITLHAAVLVALVLTGPPALAALTGVGTCDDFESGLGGWTVSATGAQASAAIGTQTASSPTRSLYTEGGVVSVTSNVVNLSAAVLVDLDIWVRRGSNTFSGVPENNENLVVEYLANGGAWTALETFAGGGTAGEIFTRSYALPSAALHAGFQARVRQTGGNGNTDYWHVDDVCLVGNTPISYSLEESAWTGAAGEVQDGSPNGLDGTVRGGAVNAATTPALATNPGTCRYGVFDGVDDYVEIPDNAALDIPNELTITAWIYMRTLPAELHTIVSKDTNYEFHIDNLGRVYWWWEVANFRTTFTITLNRWHHIAVTYRSGSQTIYVDGISRATNAYVGTLPQNNLPVHIGTDWNFISRAFDGYIDEVNILPTHLSQTQVQTLMNQTHPCATVAAQFTLNHNNFGIHCLAETITVNAVDSISGTPLINYNAPVTLDTQNGRGNWTLLTGSGVLNNGTADDGVATYAWPLGQSQAIFALAYTNGPPVIDVDVYQTSNPGIRDTDAEGMLTFSASGFMLTATPLSNPPPGAIVPFASAQTAAVPFNVSLAAYGQTANDPVCGVIESYTGNKSLKFWSQYLNPATGTLVMRVGASPGVPIATAEAAAAAQTVAFSNGQATVGVNYEDVGRMQLLVKDDTTVNADLPGGIRGATAAFVVRPFNFLLTNIRNAAGTVANPGANDALGPVFIAAGTPFRATVQALAADGDPTPNYGRESPAESAGLAPQIVAPAAGNNPAVSAAVGFGAFASGTATGLDFVWPEVGVIDVRAQVRDSDYLGAGNVVGSTAVRVGRFIPSHFVLALNTPMLATGCAAGQFTYTGQSFAYLVAPVITATAKEFGGATTVNYTGAFFKLATATLQNRAYSDPIGTLDASGAPAIDPVVAEAGLGVATLTFGSGAGLSYARTVPQAPFTPQPRLSIVVLDADGVAALGNPAVFGASGGMLFNSPNQIRYGRLRFVNAVGSELVNLPVPLIAEHYASATSGFVANVGDTCTTGVTLTLSGFTENLGPGETCALDSGAPGASGAGCAAPAPPPVRFASPPSAGNFNLALAAPGPGNTGGVVISSGVPSYLRFNWNAALLGDENPSGQAAFGLYSGVSRQIYLREIY